VPPWELTDAIDSGDIVTALDKLHRMTQGGERHGLQVLATLHGHYQRALGLDGAPVGDERSAAAHLGMTGSTFPARKALSLSRRLGTERLTEIVRLLARADLDVRGGSAISHEAVLEVLTARLARISR
jgi:DNA polymerase-3 subunit delta